MLAEARWRPGSVALVTPQGSRRFPSLDALTREVLGESVPVEAWFDWLQGRPWPGAASVPHATGRGFEQLGWQVDLSRFAAGGVGASRRAPLPVVVRIQLDGP
jgi:outer membrane lipoprotein LolB